MTKTNAEYWPRIIDGSIERSLAALGGVLIDGPRASGKTETASFHSSSSVRLDLDPSVLELARLVPEQVLAGAPPRAVDEWQLAPELWNVARALIDQRRQPGQFIFTGSATPADEITRHSGAGRFARSRMRTMSLFESRESNGQVSLQSLLDGRTSAGVSDLTVPGYASLAVRGGWPAIVTGHVQDAEEYIAAYVESITRAELSAEQSKPDPIRMRELMRVLARNTATEVSLAKLAKEAEINERTVRRYLDTLAGLFVLEEQPAWSPRLRSAVRKRVRPKWHFADPSIAGNLLHASPERFLGDLQTFGFMFESLCVRDLRIYAQPIGGTVCHYRDESGLEVDAIVELPGGEWAAFEVKLGGVDAVDLAASNLLALAGKVDDPNRRLRSLNVLTAGVASYPREDGVNVVSLGTLGP
ncbi:MAG: DUF4143 domain-containing protein [Scrofimicrobium sp.]